MITRARLFITAFALLFLFLGTSSTSPPPPADSRDRGVKFVYDPDYQRMYVVEPGAGLEVINFENQGRPVIEGYLRLKGVHDVVILDGELMYANSGADLLTIEIPDGDLTSVKIKHANRLVFQESFRDVWKTALHSIRFFPAPGFENDGLPSSRTPILASNASAQLSFLNGIVRSKSPYRLPGVNGSFSCFTLADRNTLLAIDRNRLTKFGVGEGKPNKEEDKRLGNTIQTISNNGCGSTFVGCIDGTYIIETKEPGLRTIRLEHVNQPDPVAAEARFAFYTLYDRNGDEGRLNVIDTERLPAFQDRDQDYGRYSSVAMRAEVSSMEVRGARGVAVNARAHKVIVATDSGVRLFSYEPNSGSLTDTGTKEHVSGARDIILNEQADLCFVLTHDGEVRAYDLSDLLARNRFTLVSRIQTSF